MTALGKMSQGLEGGQAEESSKKRSAKGSKALEDEATSKRRERVERSEKRLEKGKSQRAGRKGGNSLSNKPGFATATCG